MTEHLEEVVSDFQFAPEQIEAINAACDPANRLVVITGEAGTGKTKVLEEIYAKLTAAGYTVELCALMGKAVKRIKEVTNIPGSTIHRLLEFTHPGEEGPDGKPIGVSVPRRTRLKPLDCDIILADEYAMVDQVLHDYLLAALKTGACIRLLGDDNQLEPIIEGLPFGEKAPPSPFAKMLSNSKIKSVRLKTVFRQGKDSGILANLGMVLKSRVPKDNDQWSTSYTDQPVNKLQEYVLENYFCDDEAKKIDFSSTNNQIIVTQNTGWCGTIRLNLMLQKIFHEPDEDFILIPRASWELKKWDKEKITQRELKLHIGDKVIFRKNNMDLQVFNGETGTVIEFNKEYGDVTIDFGDKEQTFPPVQMVTNSRGDIVEYDPRKDIDLAYAITTHKSQGSQYDHVVYLINKSNSYMLSNRNFYTACSRAKLSVKIITDQISITRAIYKRG
jgi:exodeoxyribonuclease V alpha subunit